MNNALGELSISEEVHFKTKSERALNSSIYLLSSVMCIVRPWMCENLYEIAPIDFIAVWMLLE